MSKNQKNMETVSFVHIGDDVIVPSHEYYRTKSILFISTFLFISFGSFWLYIVAGANTGFYDTLWTGAITFSMPFAITIALLNMNWFEIN